MPRVFRVLRVLVAVAVALDTTPRRLLSQTAVTSPDGRNRVTVQLTEGRLQYSLAGAGRVLILPWLLASGFRGPARLRAGFGTTDTTRQSHDRWWPHPWGEVARVRAHYT